MPFKPIGSNILIRLPDYQQERVRKVGSIYVALKERNMEHDTSTGTVIACGIKCKIIKEGDVVFFDSYAVTQGLQNSGRDKARHEVMTGVGCDVPVHYIQNDYIDDVPELPKGLYLIMPEKRIYQEQSDISGSHENTLHMGIICYIRNGELFACNGYHLINRAYEEEKKSGLLYVPQTAKKQESKKQYRILSAPSDSDLQQGDIVRCSDYVETPIQGEFNKSELPKDTFYVERQHIHALIEAAAA